MDKNEKITELKKKAFDFIDRNTNEIVKIGDTIFYFAELGMQEHRTAEYTADALSKAGFKVEKGIAGMPPAWMATWGSGEPVIAAHTEGDALPNSSQASGVAEQRPISDQGAPGHVEGHNANLAVLIGGGVAARDVMEKENIKGTIKLYFAPAEEQLISRPYMMRDGYFDGVDAVIHPHVERDFSTTYGIRQFANLSVQFIFHGRSAASAYPWLANDALDAAILMDIGWGLMRQHLLPGQRSSRVVLEGGDQPNVIPRYSKVWWDFRAETAEILNGNFEKAKRIAEGAAIMAGCTHEVNIVSSCWPTRANQTMAEMIQKNIEMVGMPKWSEEDEALAIELQKKINAPAVGLPKKIKPLKKGEQGPSSNDSGCITWVIPTGRISFPANIPGSSNHAWPAGVPLATGIAHKGEVSGAKVLAASMLDLFLEDGLLDKVKKSFKEEIGDTKYFDLLPKDQKPPIDLNRDKMERWRPVMEKYYLTEKVEWK